MAHTSYRESDGEYEGIRAAQSYAEKKRLESLTWEETVWENMQKEERRLYVELQRLRTVAAKLQRTENEVVHHKEKMAKFKDKYGL